MPFLLQQLGSYQKNLKRNLLKAGLVNEKEQHRLVAIDTGRLDESISTGKAQEPLPGVFDIDVGSRGVNYAKFVEFGSGGVKNYHRNGLIVFTGIGMQYAERSIANTSVRIVEILGTTRVDFDVKAT